MKKLTKLILLCVIINACFIEMQAQNILYFKGGRLHVVNSSHQDIAWMDAPEVCIRFRDENMITPALKRMAENPEFCFSVEAALSLREYLEKYPERIGEILKYTQQGRLEWGATYQQPYPSMYDGEALVRQTYLGRKWLMKTLPGCEFITAWNEDVPGVALQLPQILAKAGIKYYQFSRFQPGFYKWYSPDGSSILGWSPGQYHEFIQPFANAKTDEERIAVLQKDLDDWVPYFKTRKINPDFMYLYSFDFSTPINFDSFFEAWNKEAKGANKKGLPFIQYSTGTMAMDYISSSKNAKFDEIMGERPDVWLYIHGPTHQKALKAGRDASRILTSAEKFATFDAILSGTFNDYPQETLTKAWEAAIYPDHGWGGKNGVITDRLFRTKFEFGYNQGKQVLDHALQSIAQKINYKKESIYAVTIFNPLSWDRTDPVTFTLDAEGRPDNHFRLIDAEGNEVACQLSSRHCVSLPGHDEVLTINFIADHVPAMGYKTYYLVKSDKAFRNNTAFIDPAKAYENKFYKVEFGKGGIKSLYDKELDKQILNTSKFNGGELFTLESIGNGAGEFTDVQQPTMKDYDKLGNYPVAWQCVESGDVYDAFQVIQPMRDARITLRIVLYKNIKRIDIETEIDGFNGENWREFRLAFPVNQQNAKVAYEVPMGVVEVGKDEIKGAAGFSKPTQIYSTPCKEVHPREVQDWFCSFDGKNCLTISSDVAVFDWLDPTDQANSNIILQPILLASRKSCHGEGNYYLQPGNHSYRFSIYSHEGDWKNGFQYGTQSNQPLRAVAVNTSQTVSAGTLPETYSFADINKKSAIISTVKKCDDDNSVIVRCYDIEGKDAEISFKLFKDVKAVFQTNLIEEEPKPLKSKTTNGFVFKLGHHAIETFKMDL